MRYQIKQRFMSLRTRFDIADESGTPLLFAEKKLVSFSSEYSIRSLKGDHELVSLRKRINLGMPRYDISRAGVPLASAKRLFTFRLRYAVAVPGADTLWVGGSLFEHNYQIRRQDKLGQPVATVSRNSWTLSDSYGLEVFDPAYEAICLAIIILVDDARQRRTQS